MALSLTQEKLLAIVPKITAGLGFPSAVLLTFFIVMDHKQGKGNPMLRALLGVTIFEGMDSMAWFLSTWCAPEWTGFAYASGTIASCEFQGFWLQWVIGGPMCNCLLAYYFYQVAVYDRSADDLARMEKYFLGGIVTYATVTSFLLLGLKQYNHIGAVCWVIGSPPDCGNSSYHPGEVACDRGDWAWLYGMVLFYIPLWICILFIIYFNFSIYTTLRGTGEAQWFAMQSLLYAVAFCVTWAPSTTWSGMSWNGGGGFPLDLASAICEPLACFWNLLIFLRNRPALRAKILYYLCGCPAELEDEFGDHSVSKRSVAKPGAEPAAKTKTSTASTSVHSHKSQPEQEVVPAPPALRTHKMVEAARDEDYDDENHPLALKIKMQRDEQIEAFKKRVAADS
jgi:hypothetical protein